jgi:hypothetical protein
MPGWPNGEGAPRSRADDENRDGTRERHRALRAQQPIWVADRPAAFLCLHTNTKAAVVRYNGEEEGRVVGVHKLRPRGTRPAWSEAAAEARADARIRRQTHDADIDEGGLENVPVREPVRLTSGDRNRQTRQAEGAGSHTRSPSPPERRRARSEEGQDRACRVDPSRTLAPVGKRLNLDVRGSAASSPWSVSPGVNGFANGLALTLLARPSFRG